VVGVTWEFEDWAVKKTQWQHCDCEQIKANFQGLSLLKFLKKVTFAGKVTTSFRVAQGQDRCSEINISTCRLSEVVGLIPGQTHSSCDGESECLCQHRFPPGTPVSSNIDYKLPNIVYGANNNVLVDAPLTIQYLNNFEFFCNFCIPRSVSEVLTIPGELPVMK
jgi:hypothetical protein